MSTSLFEFVVDMDNKSVHVKREFDANVNLVWEAWTNPDLLDQWWAPKPMISRTKKMNFEVGGSRFYAMISPEGQEFWSLQEYTSISPKTNFKMTNTFCDENGNKEAIGSNWDLTFSDVSGKTIVDVFIKNESYERMVKMLEMRFKEGFTAILENLEQLLKSSIK